MEGILFLTKKPQESALTSHPKKQKTKKHIRGKKKEGRKRATRTREDMYLYKILLKIEKSA